MIADIRTAVLLGALASGACGPAVGVDSDAAGSATESDPTGDVAPRPSTPGAVYAQCRAATECDSEFCVFPPGEPGFCSQACADGTPDDCPTLAGLEDAISCLDIDLPDGRLVCAIDCADHGCPGGMRCEGIETSSGARRICF
jgi:hypothetical protein